MKHTVQLNKMLSGAWKLRGIFMGWDVIMDRCVVGSIEAYTRKCVVLRVSDDLAPFYWLAAH